VVDPTSGSRPGRPLDSSDLRRPAIRCSRNRSFDGAGRLSSQSGPAYTRNQPPTPTTRHRPKDRRRLPLCWAAPSLVATARRKPAPCHGHGQRRGWQPYFDTLGNLRQTPRARPRPTSPITQPTSHPECRGRKHDCLWLECHQRLADCRAPRANPTQTQYGYNARGAWRPTKQRTSTMPPTLRCAGQRTKSAVSVSPPRRRPLGLRRHHPDGPSRLFKLLELGVDYSA